MQRLMIVVLCLTAGVCFAARKERVKVGGCGKVAVVNASAVSTNALKSAADKLANFMMVDIEVVKGEWSLKDAKKGLEATGANAAVFVIDDKTMPMSLIAMEEKWGMANANGLDEKSVEKELLRVMTVVIGGASSKYEASVMRPVFSKADLEKKAGDIVTFDSIMAIFGYLPDLGIKPYKMMSRELAIEKGLIKADQAK